MDAAQNHDFAPFWPSVALAVAFLLLCLIRLAIPSAPYFDETHYVPAARAMAELSHPVNVEHPLLGKQIIAAGIALFGDTPFGWRFLSVLFGALALFAAMRALWFASLDRVATLAGGFLLATGFPLFIHARIAMLDIFMIAFAMIALWQCAAAVREPEHGRWRLAAAGIALGLALGSKWNVITFAMVPGLAFFVARLGAGRRRLLVSTRGAPVPGVSLLEAGLWLGVVPLLVYWLTFWPAWLYAEGAISPFAFVAHHVNMIELQRAVIDPHPYQSQWHQWIANTRGIWYLYEPTDGAQRGVLLIGNPVTVLLGLPALVWCTWAGIMHRRRDALAMVVLFIATMSLWFVSGKPIQFYYHYFLPSCFLFGALALALAELWRGQHRWAMWTVLAASLAMFVYFFPILSAGALEDDQSFLDYAWIEGWV